MVNGPMLDSSSASLTLHWASDEANVEFSLCALCNLSSSAGATIEAEVLLPVDGPERQSSSGTIVAVPWVACD